MDGAVVPIEQRLFVLDPGEDHLLASGRARRFDSQASWRRFHCGHQVGGSGLIARALLGEERRAKEQETEGDGQSDFLLHANLLSLTITGRCAVSRAAATKGTTFRRAVSDGGRADPLGSG